MAYRLHCSCSVIKDSLNILKQFGTAVFRSLVTNNRRNRPIQKGDFELVYCARVEKFVTSNLKTTVYTVWYTESETCISDHAWAKKK